MPLETAVQLLAVLALAAGADAAPTVTLCGKPQPPVRDAQLRVLVEVFGPGDGTPANPVARFPGIRVGYTIAATTLPEDRHGEDGGIEPELALFEPLTPEGRYHLPWLVPAGTKLVEDDRWGGWSAWLGNDNAAIEDNTLELAAAGGDRLFVRWQGRIGSECDFELAGTVRIDRVRLSAPGDTDVDSVLATVFGDLDALGAQVAIERRFDTWTKQPRVSALVTPR